MRSSCACACIISFSSIPIDSIFTPHHPLTGGPGGPGRGGGQWDRFVAGHLVGDHCGGGRGAEGHQGRADPELPRAGERIMMRD